MEENSTIFGNLSDAMDDYAKDRKANTKKLVKASGKVIFAGGLLGIGFVVAMRLLGMTAIIYKAK